MHHSLRMEVRAREHCPADYAWTGQQLELGQTLKERRNQKQPAIATELWCRCHPLPWELQPKWTECLKL